MAVTIQEDLDGLVFAGADAYVSAYLADFSERVGVRPGTEGELRLEASIPVGGLR